MYIKGTLFISLMHVSSSMYMTLVPLNLKPQFYLASTLNDSILNDL